MGGEFRLALPLALERDEATAGEGVPARESVQVLEGTCDVHCRGRGICVEPQPDLAQLYNDIRPRDTVFEGLVGRQSGVTDFHIVDRLHGFSTTVKTHAEGASKFGASHRTVRMPILTMAELCEKHGVTEIDFLNGGIARFGRELGVPTPTHDTITALVKGPKS